jgi:DNA invertase Pin-like site-specific DNA recombinase
MNSKITEQHQSKSAYIYVRQSTPAQILHHQESTERQYALRQKALELGWSEPTVRTLDRDLGISGAQTTGRTDFKTLVADVSMGQVGAVFALEVSRLARSNADWYRLLELCALTHTLVIDKCEVVRNVESVRQDRGNPGFRHFQLHISTLHWRWPRPMA